MPRKQIFIDISDIDNAWPSNAPLCMALKYNRRRIGGLCISIKRLGIASPADRLARLRVYEGFDRKRGRFYLLISYLDFSQDHDNTAKKSGLSSILFMIAVAYGHELGYKTEDILFPAGLYGLKAEKRATHWGFRLLTTEELADQDVLVRNINNVCQQNSGNDGIYCVDKNRLAEIQLKAENVLTVGWLHPRFGVYGTLRRILSLKARALLQTLAS